MIKLFQIFSLLLVFVACKKEEVPKIENKEFISAVDISSFPEIATANLTFYNSDSVPTELLTLLKNNGVNAIRLRMWVNPKNAHSGFTEVRDFSATLKAHGFKIWLTLHYSDSWADPSQQVTPQQWRGLSFSNLKDSVYNYTQKVVSQIQPDFIQIGNEINTGFLHPQGHISNNYLQFVELLDTAIAAVRSHSNHTQIILHFAGIQNSDWFFDKVSTVDFDIIGLSYYPKWHGKSLANLKTKMEDLSGFYNKKIVIAETAYPFTLKWNDQTNNIIGKEDQLILPDFPASQEGQRKYLSQIITLTREVENGLGICYWSGDWVAWKGTQATDGSPWENQALFNFNNVALPVLREFKVD